MLKLQEVSKHFGGVKAIQKVSFELQANTIFGLIGPNGAGKTTLFNLISGTLKVSKGKIYFQNQDITHLPAYKRSRLGITRTFQNLSLYPDLTCLENVLLGAASWIRPKLKDLFVFNSREYKQLQKQAREFLDLVGLKEKEKLSPSQLSYGHQRKLEIARCLMSKPRLILLDEPAAGLNNQESHELANLLAFLKKELNLTLLIIEHDMDIIMSISDEILVLIEGKPFIQDTPKNVQKNPEVIKAYLGEEDIFADIA